MKKTTILFCAGAALATLFAGAAEVAFTGAATTPAYTGETEPWRNLCTPANYEGGALPTADDILVYDFSAVSGKTHAQYPYIRGDLAVKGIVIKNCSGDFSLETYRSVSVLTIGSEGISLMGVGGLAVSCRTATAADQTWKADNTAYFAIGNTITATENGQTLTFGAGVKGGTVVFRVAPCYDGHMVFATGNRVSYRKNGKWADSIKYSGKISANDQTILFEPQEDLDWETIFPTKRSYTWADDFINQFQVGYSSGGDNAAPPYKNLGAYRLRVSDSTYSSLRAGMYVPGSGILELTGTADWTTANVYTYIGPGDGYPNRCDGSATCIVDGDARLGSIFVNVGYWGRWSEGGERVLDQRGGTVYGSWGLNVGGNASRHNDTSRFPLSNPSPWNEFVLGGGTFNATKVRPSNWTALRNMAVNTGLGICSQDQMSLTGNNKPTSAGVFTMTGGVANVSGVHFGAYRGGWWASSGQAPCGIGDGFGAFYLGGGTFNLGADGFFLGTGWNGADADESNSVYRISLGGGTLATTTAQTNALSVCFPPTGTPAEIAAARDFRQLGPIHGSGTLRKTGAGTLSLADASRFTGDLEVREGAVSVDYTPTVGDAATLAADCICFQADTLAETCADGAEVTGWTSTDGNVTAGPCTTLSVLNPRYKANVFNGHGGVEFYTNFVENVWKGCTLEIPGASNPLVGSEDHTIVVVFRPDNFNPNSTYLGDGDADRTDNLGNQVFYSQGILGSFWETDKGVGLALMSHGRPALYEGFHDTSFYCGIGYRIVDRRNVCEEGKVSVAIGTLQGAYFTLDIDGEEWSEEYDEVRTMMTAGTTFKRFYTADQKTAIPRAFFFGNTGSGNKNHTSAFRGQIAEIRIYPNTALDAATRKTLALALLARYDENAAARQVAYLKGDSLPGAFTAAATTALPSGATQFDAAALAAAGTASAGAPTTVAGELNGHDVIRFGGADALTLAADATPIAGQTAFTAAVVFKTTTEGTGENGYAIGAGLVSTWQGGTTDPDYALSFRRFGTVGAGMGETTGAQFCNDVKPARLDDGLPHVAVFAVDPAAKKMHVMTDGRLTTKAFFSTTTAVTARGGYATTIGALNAAKGFFTGDIAEVVFYDRALGEDEMTQLSEAMAGKYAFRLLDTAAHTTVAATGFNPKSITVAAGAALHLPRNEAAPVTLGAGGSLAVAGTLTGSVRLGAGAVYDAVASSGRIDDLQLRGATFKASKTAVAAVDARLSGTARLVLDGAWPNGMAPSKYAFATFSADADVADVTWTCDETNFSRVTVDHANRRLVARFRAETVIILR